MTPSVRIDAPEFMEQGSTLEYSVVIGNDGDVPVQLNLTGREIIHDMSVIAEGGATVWRRLENQSTQAILRIESLEPGGEIIVEGSWDGCDSTGAHVAPGFYTLQASFPTDEAPLISRDRLLQVLKR
jgi:hypothetical protein